jgi:lysophospholipase L1-like esterase
MSLTPSRIITRSISFALLTGCVLLAPASTDAQSSQDFWIGTWGTALVGRPQTRPVIVQPVPQSGLIWRAPDPQLPANPKAVPLHPQPPSLLAPPPLRHFSGQTLRQIARLSMGGTSVRVVLSNAFGTMPMTVGKAAIAIRDSGPTLRAGTARPLTFSSRAFAIIPPGAVIYSDPVDLVVPSLGDVVVDLFLPHTTDRPSPLAMHDAAFQTNYISGPGDFVSEIAFEPIATTGSWFLLSRIEVAGTPGSGTIATIGDSITDGSRSTLNANSRWPDRLAARLTLWNSRLGVVNMGIAGNRVISDSTFNRGVNVQARFDRDVLTQPNVAYVIVLGGINDIGVTSASVEELIAAHTQLVQRAHAQGIPIYGATLTPFEGAAYYTREGEVTRQALNKWIRTSGTYDAVIDFDAAIKDPSRPHRLLPSYDSGDHLHPNDFGYTAMGNAIKLELFGPPSNRR